MEKNIKIGFVSKAHGIKGEIFIKIFDKEVSYLNAGAELFLNKTPYVISKLRVAKEGLIVKLKNIETRNESELLKGLEVSVSESIFKEDLDDGKLYLNQLLDYKVFLRDRFKGHVCGFAETAAHDLLRIRLESEGVVELPYVKEFIKKINNLERSIQVDCPEELFDEDFLNSAGAQK